MSAKAKLAREIWAKPVRANIHWDKIERFIKLCGGTVTYGGGSAVAFEVNGVRAVLHSPHPQKETPQKAIRRIRALLEEAGVDPNAI